VPKPPKPPKPPSGGGGGSNTNNCNTLCNAIPSSLALVNALNAAGGNYSLQLNYDVSPSNSVIIVVKSVNLQTCTIQGTELGTTNNITVSCAFAFANFVDLQVTSGPTL